MIQIEVISFGKYIVTSNYHKIFITVAVVYTQLSMYCFLTHQDFKTTVLLVEMRAL